MNGRNLSDKPPEVNTTQPQYDAKHKANRIVLLSSGKIVSCSYLIAKNKFRYLKHNNLSGAALAKDIFRNLEKEDVGSVEIFNIKNISIKVKRFVSKY